MAKKITIDAKDWFDLDEPLVNNIYVDLPPDARKSSDIRPKHVLGEAGSEVWFHSQQYAFERHMERLGIPKTGTRSSDSHSAAGERPLVGLGGRF